MEEPKGWVWRGKQASPAHEVPAMGRPEMPAGEVSAETVESEGSLALCCGSGESSEDTGQQFLP